MKQDKYKKNSKNFLVYCILETENDIRTELLGVNGVPVSLIEYNTLGAVVSCDNDRDTEQSAAAFLNPSISQLLIYENVIETLHKNHAVLPMRYGCVFKYESEVIELLKKNHQEYKKTLGHIKGCIEFGIRILMPFTKNTGVRNSYGHGSLHSGKNYLLAKKAYYTQMDQASEEETKIMTKIQCAFQGLYVESKEELSQKENIHILSLYFLIKRKQEKKFRKTFRTISIKEPIKILLSGPWPPYNFVH